MLDKEQWGEFVKCLDLFCQEVISRQELLDLVKDLFEDENLEVYDQFTQVLTDRGVVENPMEEVWFSMPLSEIDFSQCRKCTPSYRALPSGYPIPPCSERSTMEQSVLNDNWVSVRLLLSYTKLHESTYTHTHNRYRPEVRTLHSRTHARTCMRNNSSSARTIVLRSIW